MKTRRVSGNVNLNKCVVAVIARPAAISVRKNSLDVNLPRSRSASRRGNLQRRGPCSVSRRKAAPVWIVNSVYTNADLRKREGEVLKIRARKVVLAAGTLGSSEILLRSRDLGLQVSDAQLGKRCSTNGDMLIAD